MPLSAYGVNLAPPAPVSYSMSAKPGDISSVVSQVQAGQNQANAANNQRYQQALQLLTSGAHGANLFSNSAISAATNGFNQAQAQMGNSLANNQTVYNNDRNRATQDAQAASSHANQSAISRGLGNTTIVDSLQQGVQRAKNDAFANLASKKAESDNGVYQTLANISQNKGSTLANLNNQAGQTFAQGSGNIANAVMARNDIAPSLSDYASLIQSASASQNSGGRSTITTTIPDTSALGQRISGGIGSSMGLGGFVSGGGGSGGGGGAISSSVGGGGGTTGGGGATFLPGSQWTGNDMSPSSGGLASLPGSGTASGFTPTQAGTPGEVGGAAGGTQSGSTSLAGATGIYDMQNHLVGYKLPNGQMIPVNNMA